jgi:quercetin dioxygenase-like cupin family protein
MEEPYSCEQVVPIEEEPRHHLIIANEYVRAFAVEIAAHERSLCHHHPNDYLLYVARGAKIISAARGEEPKQLNYEDGECEFLPAGLVHVVDNVGDTAFRNVVVEVLAKSKELRRGVDPEHVKGHSHVNQLLDEAAGAVFRVGLVPGSEVEISGPAVVAAAYDEAVMVKEVDEFDISLDSFRKLMWVCAPRKIAVRNEGQMPARVIVFQVGAATEAAL